MQSGLVVRRLRAEEVPAAHQLEVVSYPEDEAASLEGMTFRQANAPQFFYGLFEGEKEEALVGFINGTCCMEEELHHSTMSQHNPAGPTLCIHSVVIQPKRRRHGLATDMLKEYVQKVLAEERGVARMRLIAKAHNLGLYQRAGFRILRLSPVVHGRDTWFEMGLDRLSVREDRGRPFVQVDAFTSRPFGGNPAAVVFCEGGEAAEWMQSWASEINLSETSFLTKMDADGGQRHVYALRWFTPLVEVDLCGHATLAAAHALWATGRVPPLAPIAFETKSGRLLASQKEETDGDWIWLDFPAEPPSPMAKGPANPDWQCVYEAFGCREEGDIVYIGRNRVDLLVVLTHEAFQRLAGRAPDNAKLDAIDCRGIIATCRAAPGDGPQGAPQQQQQQQAFDLLSRFFGPHCGIAEDPVTGSAHCCLGPYWGAELQKTSLLAYQASKRGGALRVELDEARGRVRLGGQAVLLKHGFLGC